MVPIARRMPQFQVIGGVAVAWIVHIRDSNPTNNRVIWSPITFEMNPIDEKWRPIYFNNRLCPECWGPLP